MNCEENIKNNQLVLKFILEVLMKMLKNQVFNLQGNHCYRGRIWSGISLALVTENTQMDQEQTEQQNLGIGKQQGRIER